MEYSRVIITTYSELLGTDRHDAEYFIRKIPIEKRVDCLTFILGIKLKKSPLLKIKNLIEFWFNSNDSEEVEFGNKIYRKTQNLDHYDRRTILNYYSSLRFAEICLSDLPYEDNTENININILKAYLKLNNENIERYDSIALKSVETVNANYPKYRKGASINFTRSVIDDYTNADINQVVLSQWIKSIYLFELLSSNEVYSPLLQKLYETYEISDWKEYLLKLMGLVRFVISNQNHDKAQQVEFDDDKEQLKSLKVFDDLCIKYKSEIEDIDFKGLRNKPVIKLGERSYRFIFDLFVAEKLYNGQYWLIKDLNSKLDNNSKIDDRRFFTHEFSEKVLLYQTIDYIFDNQKIKIKGEELESKYDGSIDYYLRDNDVVYLFESKDIFISADSKSSGDFSRLEPEIKKKLHSDGAQRKAIKQLAYNMEKILSDDFPLDTASNKKKLIFIPIVVVHHRVFNSPGLNVILNYWMKETIDNSRILSKHKYRIMGINLIDIDSLIFNRELLKNKNEIIFNLAKENINQFQFYSGNRSKHRISLKDVEKSFLSISDRLDKYLGKNKKRSPGLFLEKSLSLFKR